MHPGVEAGRMLLSRSMQPNLPTPRPKPALWTTPLPPYPPLRILFWKDRNVGSSPNHPPKKRDKDIPSFFKKQTLAIVLRKILNFVKFEPASTFPIYDCARPLTRALTMEARS